MMNLPLPKAFAGFLTGNLLALNESGPPEAVLKWYPMWWTGNRMSAWWMYDFQYACEALRCGAVDYLLKPLDKDQLQKRIEQVVVENLHGTVQLEVRKNEDPILRRPYEEFSPLIRKIVMIVAMEYGQHISLKSIADRFRMNATYLGQIFIKETDMKFSEYLMAYRMYVARERILNTDDKISSVAAEVGYSNMNYFYQHFHNYYDSTPSEMRAGKN